MTVSNLAATVTGEHLLAKFTGEPECPSPAEVARLAYELYEMNGRQEGRDLDDWLLAERHLTYRGALPLE